MVFSAVSSFSLASRLPAFGCKSCKPDLTSPRPVVQPASGEDTVTLTQHGNTVVPVTADSFEESVLKSPQPVLVDFYANWCPPCKVLAPVLDDMAANPDAMPGNARIAKVNVDEESTLTRQYNVQSMPTLVLFNHGKEVARQVGAMDKAALTAWITEQLGSNPA